MALYQKRERLSKYWTHCRELHRGSIGRREGKEGQKYQKFIHNGPNSDQMIQ